MKKAALLEDIDAKQTGQIVSCLAYSLSILRPRLVDETASSIYSKYGDSKLAVPLEEIETSYRRSWESALSSIDAAKPDVIIVQGSASFLLSDVLGLNAYNNGANTWSQFDTSYPNPSVANLQSVASAITANSPYTSTVTYTAGDSVGSGNALNSSANTPAYGSLPDLGLGQYSGFTVQAWFNSSVITSNSQKIIDLGNESSNSDNIIVGISGSKLYIQTYNGSTGVSYSAGQTLASNTWYHVTAVFSGTTGTIYLNGSQIGTSSSMAQVRNVARANNYWGMTNGSNNTIWQGQQDELRFWNRALTAAEIASNYNISFSTGQSGLIAYYKADETSGNSLNDSSGNGNNATLQIASSVTVANNSFETPTQSSKSYTPNHIRRDLVFHWRGRYRRLQQHLVFNPAPFGLGQPRGLHPKLRVHLPNGDHNHRRGLQRDLYCNRPTQLFEQQNRRILRRHTVEPLGHAQQRSGRLQR